MVAQEREDMHLCQWGICYSNFMAVRIIRQGCHCAQADCWQHLRPQPCVSIREVCIQGFVPLLFYISVFYHDLNWDFLHIPLLSFLTRLRLIHSSFILSFSSLQMCCLLHSCSSFLREGGSSGVAGASSEARRDSSQISGDLQLVVVR